MGIINLTAAIDHVVYYVNNRVLGESVLEPTGPKGLGMVINTILDNDPDTIYKIGDQERNGMRYKILDHPNGQEIIMYQGKPCMYNKYQNYNTDRQEMTSQPHYYNLWMTGKIYK